jgi:ribonuclease P protein component
MLPLMKRHSLTKDERLLRSSDFKRVVRKGQGQSTQHFTIFVCPNQTCTRRLGITLSRKTGSASSRNRIKRLVREFFRCHKQDLPPSSDILFIAKPGVDRLDHTGLYEELKFLLLPHNL